MPAIDHPRLLNLPLRLEGEKVVLRPYAPGDGERFFAALEEDRITVIAVSQDLQGRKPVRAFFESARIANLEPFIDPDNVLTTAVGGNIAMPTTILYDSQGREVWRVVGGVEWDDAEVARLLDEAA